MSRRKQVKPQHVNLETDQGEKQLQQLAPDFADVAPVVPTAREPCAPMNHPETGDDMNGDQVKAKRLRREESHICEICCGEFFSFSEFSEHKKNCTKHIPVFIMNDSEGLVPSEDVIRAVVSHQPHSASSEDSHKKDGGNSLDMKKKPWVDSLLYSKMKTAQPPTPQDLSYLPKGGVTNTNVTLQALRGTKVAMDQQRAPMLPAPLPTSMPSDNSIPWVLEQILCLQQQQLQQIQLTEQIRVQVNLWATHAFRSSVAGAATLTSLDSHMSQQVQGPSLDSLKQAKLPHENISSTTGYASPGLGSLALSPGGSRVPPNHLPGALISQASGSVVFQSPFSTVALDPSKKGLKGKPPNVSPVYVKPQNQATLYRYKCKYCSKVFGTRSCLQIHLRSHTEERLFMCSVCGHWFTTEDNLKVHFHQHFQVKANPQLLHKFHDKIATGIGVPYALSVPAPIDESSLSLDSKPVLVTGIPNVGLPQNLSLGANPKDLMVGPLANELQPQPSPESKDRSLLSGMGLNHNSPKVGGFQRREKPEPGSETLKLQQLVENIDKATTKPNECLICHRILSCQRSLKMHYRTHTMERPFRCNICDRAFSTKDNLKTHFGVHRTNTSIKTQHSCPICQKKFTNAVMLQQHIRMHMGGQIPNTPVLESPCDFTGPQLMMVGENGSTSTTCHNDVVKNIDTDKIGSQDAPSSSPKVPMPLPSIHSASSMLGFSVMTPLDAPGKVGPDAVVLQQQNSRGNGLVERGCLTNNSSSSVMKDQEYQSQSPDIREMTSFQALSLANSQAESIKSKSPNAGGKAENSENSHTEVEGCSNLPSTFVHAQSTYVKVEVPGAFGLTTISPGMAPLLAAPPCQQGKQHGCTQFGKKSLASALQIHEKTHTGEKPFICNICEQAFTTKGSLQVHYMTHGANNSSAHCERKLAIENTTTLLGTDGKKLPEMDPQEIMSPSVNVDPVVWDQNTLMPTGGLAKTTNKISVIQRVGIPTLPVSLEASSIVNNTIVSKIDGSQPATSADVEKPGAADSILKHQLPHLLEEDKVSVS
ncbi:sal-like protein 4 [Molossus nigricans]